MKLHRVELLGRTIVAGMLAASLYLAPSAAWATCSGTMVPAPREGNQSVFFSAAALSSTDAWAVGRYSTNLAYPLIEHWNGINWSIIPSGIDVEGSGLSDVAAISSNNAWAVGNVGDPITSTLIEHWNGLNWTRISSPDVSGNDYLLSLAVLSSSSIWAVGQYKIQQCVPYNCRWVFGGSFTEYWNGTTWAATKIPGSVSLQDVSRAGFHNAWAVGSYFNGSVNQTLTEHWNGSGWSVVPSPNEGVEDWLSSVAPIPASSQAWAAGQGAQPLIEKFDGTQWSIVASPTFPAESFLNDIAATGPSNAWAVGQRNDGPLLAMHWNGAVWSTVSLKSQQSVEGLYGLAKIPGSAGLWGVGFAGYDPLVEFLHC